MALGEPGQRNSLQDRAELNISALLYCVSGLSGVVMSCAGLARLLRKFTDLTGRNVSRSSPSNDCGRDRPTDACHGRGCDAGGLVVFVGLRSNLSQRDNSVRFFLPSQPSRWTPQKGAGGFRVRVTTITSVGPGSRGDRRGRRAILSDHNCVMHWHIVGRTTMTPNASKTD
jgi:hypothetical protein